MARRVICVAALLCAAVLWGPVAAHADDDDDATHAARWAVVREAVFGSRPVLDGTGRLSLDAPKRAEDAALVPLAVRLARAMPLKALYLTIDDNPSPLAAHFTFGPLADPRDIHLRVRVDQYTEVHAVIETPDGTLYGVKAFVKAAGGCSAPADMNEAAALRQMGLMKLRLLDPYAPGRPLRVQLLIRHPNFNGMQMNQVTRLYTPARFIDETDVRYDGASVFHLDSDISMSSDPVITFGFVPGEKGRLTVVARDNENTVFTHGFDIPDPKS